MANRLAPALPAPVELLSATTAPFPPLRFGTVPAGWSNAIAGVVPEFDFRLKPAGASGPLTDLKFYGGEASALTIAAKTFTAANATEILTAVAHGLYTGDGPVQLTNAGGALPAGLALLTDYWIIRIDANTFYFATTRALAGAGTVVAITGDGTGTHTLTGTADATMLVWLLNGVAEPTINLASAREGYRVRCQHSPVVTAYAPVWTGTASSAIAASISPVMEG